MKRTLREIENDGFQDHTVLGKLYEVDEEHAREQLPYLVSQLLISDFNPSRPIFMLIRSRFYPVRRRDDDYYYFDEGGRPTYYAVHCTLDNLIAIMKIVEHPFDTYNYTTKEIKYSGDILLIFDQKRSLKFNDDAHGRERSRKGINKITHVGFFTTPLERANMIVPIDINDKNEAPNALNTDPQYAAAIYSAFENVERFVPNEGYKTGERKGMFFGYKLNEEKMKEDTPISQKWKELLNQPQYLEKFQIPFGQEEKLKEEDGPVSFLYNFSIPCLLNAIKNQVDEEDFKFLQDRKIIYGVGAKTRDFRKYLTSKGYFIRSYRIQPVENSFKINSDCYPKKSKESMFASNRIIKIMFWNEHWMPYDHDLLHLLEISERQGYLIRYNAYEFAQCFSNYSYDKMIKFDEELFFQHHFNGYQFNTEFDYDIISYKEPETSQYIIFADFESSVNEEFHRPYLISFEGIIVNNAENDDYSDWIKPTSIWQKANINEVGYLFLNNIYLIVKHMHITKLIRIYFYNLHYDFTFLLEYLSDVERLVKENTLYSVKATFKDIKLEFWDALPIFRCTLKKAANDYLTPEQKLTIKKEVFPYTLYTFDFFKENPDGWCDIELFYNHFDNKEKIKQIDESILKKAISEDGKRINYVGYAKFYCIQDVRCLKNIMINFAKLLNGNCLEGINGTLPFRLNLWKYRTSSSIGYDYFKRTVLLKKEKKKFVPLFNWCLPKGVLRHIIQRTIRGGRVMTRDNEKWHFFAENTDSFLQDYDFVSLYPSAMYLLWVTDGCPELIKGEYNEKDIIKLFCPPEMNIEDENKYNFKDGCIHVTYINTRKDRHFPQLCIKDEKTKLNNYTNFHNQKVSTWVNVIDIFNLIEFQNAEIKWDGGIVWRGNRHYEIRDSIKKLFEFRKNNKKHPIQLVVKLILNSIFGKSILKPVDREKIYVEKIRYRRKTVSEYNEETHKFCSYMKYVPIDNWQEYFNANAYRIHRFEDATDKYMDVELYKRDMSSSFNIFGSNVLAMARRVISRVMSLAEDIEEKYPNLSPGIFYTDTDSMHIRSDLLKLVEQEFKEKYGKEIKGVELTQCHTDFDIPENFIEGEKIMGAQESYFLMKKAYCDKLIGDKGSVGYHMRLKGIPTDLVHYEDYKKLFEGESIKYDLLDGHASFFYRNGKVGSRVEMTREIMTRDTREKRLKE